jgi:hypothetical protein
VHTRYFVRNAGYRVADAIQCACNAPRMEYRFDTIARTRVQLQQYWLVPDGREVKTMRSCRAQEASGSSDSGTAIDQKGTPVNPSQFDTIARLFANRRLSRRQTLASAVGGMAGLGPLTTAAQETTPAATPAAGDSTGVPFMFVQTFGAGSLAPKEGEAGVLLLRADHLAGQTIYFSDRPERIVGMVPTASFLGIGVEQLDPEISQADPPNAALVLGDGEVAVLELMNPAFDPATGALTYDVTLLEDYEEMDLQLEQEPLTVDEAPRAFDAASLFIDDCSNGSVVCLDAGSGIYRGNLGGMGFCWTGFCCYPCQDPPGGASSWADACNAALSSCSGSCAAFFDDGWLSCASG